MGADGLTCGVCGTAYYGGSNICFRTPESTAAHWKKGYERQRARADAAERERDSARRECERLATRAGELHRDKTNAEATIATLREEVERLREVDRLVRKLEPYINHLGDDGDAIRHRLRLALSPPQAPHPQGGEG